MALERFTLGSPTDSSQWRKEMLWLAEVLPSRAAAIVHSLGRKPQEVEASAERSRSEPQSGRQEGSPTTRACHPFGAGKGPFLSCRHLLGPDAPGYELPLLRSLRSR